MCVEIRYLSKVEKKSIIMDEKWILLPREIVVL